jgi:hypothetical protein
MREGEEPELSAVIDVTYPMAALKSRGISPRQLRQHFAPPFGVLDGRFRIGVVGTLPAEDFAGRMVPRDRSGVPGCARRCTSPHPFFVLTEAAQQALTLIAFDQ